LVRIFEFRLLALCKPGIFVNGEREPVAEVADKQKEYDWHNNYYGKEQRNSF